MGKHDTVNEEGGLAQFEGWSLQEAKARFSELVRKAQERPQRVTLHGNDTVMVISTKDFKKLYPTIAEPSLHKLLSESPLRDLEFGSGSVKSPVRDVEL